MSLEQTKAVTLRLPSTLSAYSGGKSQITVQANTVEELLTGLRQFHPRVWERLCTEQNTIRQHVKIFVNNQLITSAGALKTPLHPGQEVIVLTATANA